MLANGEPAPTTAPSFESFSFSFSRPSLLSRLNMSAQAVEPEPSSSTSSSAVTGTTNFSGAEPTTSGASFDSNTRSTLDEDMSPEEDNVSPSRNDLDRNSSTPRAGSPDAMEIDINGDPEIMEISSSQAAGGSRIPASYRDLPTNHHFVAPPAFLPYPRSPVRRFPEGHPPHTPPSLFGHLPRAPPRSPRLDPLQILELESARERNEWEQVCNELGRPKLERRGTIAGPSQAHFTRSSVPQTQVQVNGNAKKAISQAPPSEDDYESDSSDVELRIYNADSIDESQPNSALGTVPPTPLGARPPVTQSLTVPNGAGSVAHRAIIERLSQGPGTPGVSGSTPEAAADRPAPSNNTTPAKRKVDDVDDVAQESSAKRKSPAPHQPNSERTGVPPPLRAQVDRIPAPLPSSSVPPVSITTNATPPQATTPQPIASSSSSTSAPSMSGSICELQKSTPSASPAPPAIESPFLSSSAPTTTVVPPVAAPPLSRTPSLASAPPLSTNPSPPRRTRTRCRYFSRSTGCARGADCQFAHGSHEQTSRPPSRQLAPSPIPAIQAPMPTSTPTATLAPIPVRVGPKAPLPATAASLVLPSAAGGPSIPAPATVAPTVPFHAGAPFVPTSTPLIFAPTPVPHPTGTVHPLPAKPPPAVTSPNTSPKANDSPQEPSGSSVLPSELTQSQSRTQAPPPRTDEIRPEVVQTQPRPIAPLPARAVPSPAPTPTSAVLTPRNRPPPPPYRPPPGSNTNSSPLAQAPPAPVLLSAAPLAPAAPPAPTVPVTAVIPPTPARPVPEQSAPQVPATSASNGPTMNTANPPAANIPRPPVASGTTTQVVNTPKPPAQASPARTATGKLTIPVPPRSNPPLAPPRPDMAPDSSPPQTQMQLRPRNRQASREPARPDDRALVRRTSPVRRNSRDLLRRNSPSPEPPRSLMTRIDYRSNPGGSSYRPPSRSRSPRGRHYSPPPLRRRSPPPPRGRSPSPARYRDWRSRSRSPIRRPLRERFVPRAMPPRRSPSPRYSLSPSRSPIYRSPLSPSRSISRSPSRSPPRQRFEPRPPADGYSKGSAYFPAEKNIPRAWESEAGSSRPVQNQGYDPSPIETMVIVDEPTRNSTPPPRNAINEYDSFNHSRTMDISPMSSPARGYVGSGLGNRISDYSSPAANDYSPPMTTSYAPPPLPSEQRENLLTRMTGEPDLANRLAPASSTNRGQAPNRAQPTNKSSKPQQPLANRLGGGDPYPSQASRNDRRPPPPRDTGVRGGKLMSRMTGK
ncbi:zinc finger C-x8-C-x5-C-x3-H type protein [Rhizoctonia solani 123E]|uniref:Zinc finger C-x8-C-x5-C-x3-H type protein n=1 Tax=Rhizoctonia solani 123E TaxID=1423351 RepID=A0A074RZW9_9AGAM|nr:zinc finger C-x8-C-x5-C-x3-H type protein [Rhizoctonia solani 123E]